MMASKQATGGEPQEPKKPAAAAPAAEVVEAAGKGSWFTKSAEELAQVAEKDGKKVEDIGKWARRTGKGKTAIVVGGAAAAYGLYSVIAGTGNKGPSEHAEAVNKGREAESAAGRA
jgi:hypothetical protein